jgi:hypothetical protein
MFFVWPMQSDFGLLKVIEMPEYMCTFAYSDVASTGHSN